MAATGKTPILLYGSTTPTNAPAAGNLTNSSDGCEIAINVADKNLFFKDSTNAVNTVPIRQSSASSNGWLSSTDWSTFNGKQPAGTYVTSVTGTAPVVSSGGTTPAISMAAATGSVNGYLTSTDWNTFNGKQAALVSGTNIKTVNGTTLLGSGDLGTISVSYGGTGLTTLAAGYIPYGNGTSAFGSSGSFTWDSANLIFNALGTANFGATNAAGGGGTNKYVLVQGSGVSYGAGNAGNYGGIVLSANANYTSDARQYLITNAYSVKNFAIIRSVDATTQPTIGVGGAVSSGTVDFSIDYTGNVTVNSGNLVIGTSGKGIDFSATAGTGTSELLADYEEGTWTPTVTAISGTITTVGTVNGRYTKIGRQVTVWARVTITTNGTGADGINIDGVPYTPVSGISFYTGNGVNTSTGKSLAVGINSGTTIIICRYYDATYPVASGQSIYVSASYNV